MPATDKALRATLNLPKTAFPMRANAAKREPAVVTRLTTALYQRQQAQRGSDPKPFVLHDGPPYANGALHMGHFVNRTLKDVNCRFQLLQGKRVDYVPGWDCHGLPIELKALASAAADATPQEAIKEQRQDLQRWGVMADWSGAPGTIYRTLDKAYEAAELGVFRELVKSGCVYRGKKPVYWSPSSGTALAEAELEYTDDHVSPAVYVAFPVVDVGSNDALRALPDLSLAIWTTTPWTIPANLAIAVHPDFEYHVVQLPARDDVSATHVIVAADLYWHLQQTLAGVDADASDEGSDVEHTRIVATLKGHDLASMTYSHPLPETREAASLPRVSPVFVADHVTADSGTGLVHTAPGHGHEDFLAARDLGLPAHCPVDGRGRFTEQAGQRFAGLHVHSQGNAAVIEALREAGVVLHSFKYKHRYPYDWRTKQPVIIRATKQWFANVESLHARALEQLATVTMTPPVSRHRLEAMVSGRSEWCISRQRSWGVPIPVFYDETGEPLLTEESVQHVEDLVAQHGTDCWWSMSVEELLAPQYHNDGHTYTKGMDTLDVWFDSGVSWASTWCGVAAAKQAAGGTRPDWKSTWRQADMVLEGSDQHRGWFQSSLLLGVGATGTAPYRKIVTHGFVLDAQGHKMSKSLGNVVVPGDIINGSAHQQQQQQQAGQEKQKGGKNKDKQQKKKKKKKKGGKGASPVFATPYGVDVARCWVASTDYSKDILLGTTVIGNASEALRKIRNTCRFMLGNLSIGADEETSNAAANTEDMQRIGELLMERWMALPLALDADNAWAVDKFLLARLYKFQVEVEAAYTSGNLSKVMQAVNHLCTSELSSLYLDVCKDRLYAQDPSDPQRQACLAVLWEALRCLVLALAPIAPFTADDVFLHSLPAAGLPALPPEALIDALPCTIFDVTMPQSPSAWLDVDLAADWVTVLSLRDLVNMVLEQARGAGDIGSSVEAGVHLVVPPDSRTEKIVSALEASGELPHVLVTSQATLAPAASHGDHAFCHEGSADLPVSSSHAQEQLPFLAQPLLPEALESVTARVVPASGTKCRRCWRFDVFDASSDICQRCAHVVS